MGAIEFLEKPVNLSVLNDIIEKYVLVN